MTNRWYSIAAAFLLAKTMEQELVDATTAELWLNAFDAATALEPLVDPALVGMLAPTTPHSSRTEQKSAGCARKSSSCSMFGWQ